LSSRLTGRACRERRAAISGLVEVLAGAGDGPDLAVREDGVDVDAEECPHGVVDAYSCSESVVTTSP
jgi:hypothetical protein